MENFDDQENGYQHVIDTLNQAFGQMLSKDVIAAIVESCGGDLNEAANAIMNMDDDNIKQDGYQAQATINESQYHATNQQPACTSHDVMNVNDHFQSFNDYSIENIESVHQNTTYKIQDHVEIMAEAIKKYAAKPDNSSASNPNSSFRTTQNLSIYSPKTDLNWTPQIREILMQHSKGSRLLIIMRGVPGSGKTYLSKKIVEMTIGAQSCDYKRHILSTDDFFMSRGSYNFDKTRLSYAHQWNHSRASTAMSNGLSPVIIDNTNIAVWEMEPYIRSGVENGYLIELLEPNTPWAKKVNQLARKNIHGVPPQSIKRMLDNFEHGITGDYLINFYRLSYQPNMTPPYLRNLPEVQQDIMPVRMSSKPTLIDLKNKITVSTKEKYDDVLINENKSDKNPEIVCKNLPSECSENLNESHQVKSNVDGEPENSEDNPQLQKYIEMEKQLEEFAKFEKEWEKGETWYDDSQTARVNVTGEVHLDNYPDDSKPQRKGKDEQSKLNNPKSHELDSYDSNSEKIISSNSACEENSALNESDSKKLSEYPNSNCPNIENIEPTVKNEEIVSNEEFMYVESQDWTKISMFMSPWESESKSDDVKSTIEVEKVNSSTCVEFGDTDIMNTTKPFKILATTSRDINLNWNIAFCEEKIPEKRMLDKSSMTNEQVLTEFVRCKNEEKHFIAFRKMFKHIGKSDLRDVFDRCCGDVNWAVSIVLDGMATKQLSVVDDDNLSASDDEITEQCECLAAYDIIPDKSVPSVSTDSECISESTSVNTPLKQRRVKKDLSETSIELKKQIEKNFVIPDNHYSENFLKIRKFRRGENHDHKIDVAKNAENEAKPAESPGDDVFPSTSDGDNEASTIADDRIYTDTEDSDGANSDSEYVEKTVTIDLSTSLVSQIDDFFGRKGAEYPSNISHKVNLPVGVLNEINALWMESLMDQMDQLSKQTDFMIKQDEDLARQLAIKESELAHAGKEPEVPDFKEIMDIEFALSLYQKDVAEWRNKEPNDLAAKLTREKLFNAFPDIPSDVLSELLMAHNNNFVETVEGLLVSTGKTEFLEKKNGVNKFIMMKEMEQKMKMVQEEKQALSEVEWPLLPPVENLEMSVVNKYRKEAEKHLAKRNIVYQKAREYMSRGMTDVASYYSEVAALHKRHFEYANSLAAASLIQVHATRSPDNSIVDLHYMRVNEARESVDLFLDAHIQKLQERQRKGDTKNRTLFIITGRGLHSNGQPKIKPAVKRRLAERGIAFRERNPGLLAIKVHAGHQLSYQVA